MKTMQAARLHQEGGAFSVDTIELPDPRPTDVLVQVKACGVVPNLRNVVNHYSTWFPFLPLPKLPAIYGLDAAGVVAAVGSNVTAIKPGDRVYVNPGLSCGSCTACRRNDQINCPAFTFQGYFGFGPGSQQIYDKYPYGGFAEHLIAPVSSLVRLPESVTFDQAARFGYLGTAYSALRKANFAPGQTLLINGMTGTLGLGALLLALAMGASRIFGTGRNEDLLRKAKALAPDRIHTITLSAGGSMHEVVRDATDGYGVDVLIETLGPGAPAEATLDAIKALRRGGKAVACGGMADPLPLDPFPMMCQQLSYIGSLWFSTAEGEDMAAMAQAGTLDLSVFEHQRFGLTEINEALDAVEARNGGFTNVVVTP
ncbi:alcohol dehydrogenase catalytic domain-containing protein [Herbaspirillum sp. SJZ107]|uniref:alcohol dehydrogenase catalytic domain-containing protein n=1 Tax=Herbaspirillum sp. SJZ107 TaxID=2572881 RepID=UPI00116B1232|nr:zinc-binding dehydrogenase [Herbaspirillum sp. SJZ107]TQK07842.1 alcohol dehydrogenase [Herbaspirillum sp. SJZ107]